MIKNTSKTKKFFKDLDIFGQPIPLYFEGNALYTTPFGGIITMIIICIITTLVIILARGLFSRTNYTTSTERDFKLNPDPLDLSKDFMFSIGIQDSTITLNNSIFSYTATYIISENVGGSRTQTSEISIPLHPCTHADYSDFKKEFDQYYLNYTMCPDLTSITIQGQQYSPLYTYLKLNVSKCVNGTNPGVICATDEYINNYFTEHQVKRIVLYFISSVADFDNHLNPFEHKFIDESTWTISPDSNLRVSTDLFFETNIINTFDNLFGIGNGWNISVVNYQRFKNDNVFMPDTTKFPEYLEIFIKANGYYKYTVRKFVNFAQIVSILAGVWNILYLFLGQIATRYNNALFKIDLANVLYNFDTVASGVNDSEDEIRGDNDDEQKGKYSLKKNPPLKEIEISEKKNPNTEFQKSLSKGQKGIMEESRVDMYNNMDFLNKFNVFRSKRRILKYSAKDIWTTIFRCCSTKTLKKKNLLLHKANTRLASDIDIRIILKKFKEISEIKNTIFDENQLAIFNFVPAELIALDHDGESNQIKKIHLKQQRNYLKSQLKNLCCKKEEYFFRQMAYEICKSRPDTISRNLIEKLDREAKEIFELLAQKKFEGTLNILGVQSTVQINQQTNRVHKQHSMSSFGYHNIETSSAMHETPMLEYRKLEHIKRAESIVLMPNVQNHNISSRDPNILPEENIVYAPLIHHNSTPNQKIKLLPTAGNRLPSKERSFDGKKFHNEYVNRSNSLYFDQIKSSIEENELNSNRILDKKYENDYLNGVFKPYRRSRTRELTGNSPRRGAAYSKYRIIEKRRLSDIVKKEDRESEAGEFKKFEVQIIEGSNDRNISVNNDKFSRDDEIK